MMTHHPVRYSSLNNPWTSTKLLLLTSPPICNLATVSTPSQATGPPQYTWYRIKTPNNVTVPDRYHPTQSKISQLHCMGLLSSPKSIKEYHQTPVEISKTTPLDCLNCCTCYLHLKCSSASLTKSCVVYTLNTTKNPGLI